MHDSLSPPPPKKPHHELFDVFAELRQSVTSVDLDLNALIACHVRSHPSQALLPAPAHADEHGVPTRLPQNAADPRDVDHRIRKEDEVHVVRESHVVLVQAVVQYLTRKASSRKAVKGRQQESQLLAATRGRYPLNGANVFCSRAPSPSVVSVELLVFDKPDFSSPVSFSSYLGIPRTASCPRPVLESRRRSPGTLRQRGPPFPKTP